MDVGNSSSWRIIAVLGSQTSDGGGSSSDSLGNSVHYLVLLLFKACLNAGGLALSHRSLQRSLLGVAGISLCLADTLLLCAAAGSWALGGRDGVPVRVPLCFTMSHASTVYSLLPGPFLLLAALDYACNLGRSTRPIGPCRALSCCAQVLSVWALAGLYSLRYTTGQVVSVTEDQHTVLACIVQGSSVVDHFCIGLFLAICCVLFYYYQSQPRIFKEVFSWPRLWGKAPSPEPASAAAFSHAEERSGGEEGPPDVPLLLRLTAAFASTWAPFLALTVPCVLLKMPLPAELTVNVIWLLSVNSLLIGAALWLRRDREWPGDDLPDDACAWSLYWHHGNRGAESKLEETLTDDLCVLSSSTTEKLPMPV